MMKQILAILCLLLLAACAAQPAATSARTAQTPAIPQSEPSVPAPQPAPVPSGVTSTIGGQTSSAEGIQPTGNTKNFIMTIDGDGYQPPILTVIPGDRVKITITNEDSKEHAFILKEFGVDKAVAIGGAMVVDFTPLQKGEFTWTERDGSKAGTLIVGGKT